MSDITGSRQLRKIGTGPINIVPDAQAPAAGRKINLDWAVSRQTLPEFVGRMLEECRAVLATVEGKAHIRLSLAVRELGLILADLEEDRPDTHRPVWPRVVGIMSRLIEDDML